MHVLQKTSVSCHQIFHRNFGNQAISSKCHLFVQYLESKVASFLDFEKFPPFFKACANFKLLIEGSLVHADTIKMGFDCYTSTSNSIMSFYFKVGMPDCAWTAFDGILCRDSVSWNALLDGFLSHGDAQIGLGLFIEARARGFVPNLSTLVLLLQACWKVKSLSEGQYLHGFIVKNGFASDISVQNSLLSLHRKFNDVKSAQKLFDEMPARDVISWSSLISGYAQSGDAVSALKLFRRLFKENGIEVDGLALVSAIQACSFAKNDSYGRSVHGHVIRRGFEDDIFISNSLIDMYSKCFDMTSAYTAFSQMPSTNSVSWNSILSGLIENEKHIEALLLFQSMKTTGIEGDAYTAVILLQACKVLGLEIFCRSIHSVIIRRMFFISNGAFVLNSLLDAYAKCRLIGHALKLFEKMSSRDTISWTTMVSGFSLCGEARKAVCAFIQMRSELKMPNSVTFLSLLEACSTLADLRLTKCVHGVALKNSLSEDSSVGASLLDAYSKSGNPDLSRRVFKGLARKNVLCWNAMIGALGMNGRAKEALAALEEMMAVQNIVPNGITMLSALSACSHGGLIQEGLLLFQRMSVDGSIKPGLEHYSCVVDMLARAGDITGGFEMIKRMSERGVEAGPAAWGALLSACRRFEHGEIALNAASRVLELEPLSSSGYILSLGLYANTGLPEETARLRLMMKERGVRVVSGYSLVHAGQHAERFAAWDETHHRTKEIYFMIDFLHDRMKLWHDESSLFANFMS